MACASRAFFNPAGATIAHAAQVEVRQKRPRTISLVNILTRFSTVFLAVCCACPGARAADLYQFEVSELKAPDCLKDVSSAFFSQNDQQTEPIHPVLPISNFYLLVRYLGDNALGAAPSFDFARF